MLRCLKEERESFLTFEVTVDEHLRFDVCGAMQWASVDAAGPSTDAKEGIFRRLWSLKEVPCSLALSRIIFAGVAFHPE